jgi:hypothetical protein
MTVRAVMSLPLPTVKGTIARIGREDCANAEPIIGVEAAPSAALDARKRRRFMDHWDIVYFLLSVPAALGAPLECKF